MVRTDRANNKIFTYILWISSSKQNEIKKDVGIAKLLKTTFFSFFFKACYYFNYDVSFKFKLRIQIYGISRM